MRNKIANVLRKPLAAIMLSVLLGFLVGGVVLALAGYNPIEAYITLFKGVFSKPKYVAQTIVSSTPIILTGISVAFAYKTGLFNIGADGQFMMGSIAATFLGLTLNLPPLIFPFVVVIGGALIGGLYGAIVGVLKAKFGIHEVITSIMLNWIALYANNLFVNWSFVHKPNSQSTFSIPTTAYTDVLYNYKTSDAGIQALSQNNFLKDVLLKTDLNYGIIVAILIAIAVWILLKYTTLGYSLRSCGFSKDASEFSGMNVKKNIVRTMFISGAIAGLAGALQVTGVMPHCVSILSTSEGYGFDGISVALMGGLNPFGCIIAGLFYGAMEYGGTSVQQAMGAPSEIIEIMMGTIVLFIGMKTLFRVIADAISKKGGAVNE